VWLCERRKEGCTMKKVSLILAVVLFTVPVWANVYVTCSQPGGPGTYICLVSYSNGEAKPVRAFALDITVSAGTITAVDDTVTSWYTIHPGSIVIVDGNVSNWGTPVADPCDLPSDTKPGLGHNAITIEMGALYTPPNDPTKPPSTGNLLKFTVSTLPCNVTIAENQGRGGVVLTDPNLNPNITAPGCTLQAQGQDPNCLIGGNADGTTPGSEKAAWILWGKPNCWCYCRQCRGDADGKKSGTSWVAITDLNLLSQAFGKNDATLKTVTNGICADFDHKKTGATRVAIPDLNILSAYFGKPVASVPKCDSIPVITGPFNFWCDPTTCARPGITCP